MQKIAIVGASGFVGTYLKSHFQNRAYAVTPLGRKELALKAEQIAILLENTNIIINLAGAPIIHKWSESYKKVLYHSRIDTTAKLVEAMQLMEKKPALFFSTSAIGIYATDGAMSETDFTYADDFLAHICKDWEAEAQKAEAFTRVAIFRFSVVLGEGGALSKMLPAFKLGVGGTIGDGSEPFSWIHIQDIARAYDYVIANQEMKGIYNLSAPEPVTNKILTKTLGAILHRPTIFPLPKFVLKLIFSEGATVLTQGQRVIPKRLLAAGFTFEYASLKNALRDILKR